MPRADYHVLESSTQLWREVKGILVPDGYAAAVAMYGQHEDASLGIISLQDDGTLLVTPATTRERYEYWNEGSNLLAGATWNTAHLTPPPFECVGYKDIHGYANSDVAGTIVISQSLEDAWLSGYVWTEQIPVPGGDVPVPFKVDLYSKWVRVHYVNGATNQAKFRLSFYLTPVGG